MCGTRCPREGRPWLTRLRRHARGLPGSLPGGSRRLRIRRIPRPRRASQPRSGRRRVLWCLEAGSGQGLPPRQAAARRAEVCRWRAGSTAGALGLAGRGVPRRPRDVRPPCRGARARNPVVVVGGGMAIAFACGVWHDAADGVSRWPSHPHRGAHRRARAPWAVPLLARWQPPPAALCRRR
ncbi:hypothetical protein PVAP13_2NG143812 [Panicum virgatum]|uniref:Uncharacterized protein n=1 Tax=Panicum virgatum TaxID=38727 RepID=A0A8T0VAS1_PANVG|nr:hypothetical protein PVAP13_2NG143812 [Panicum virgatum]